MTSLVQSHSRPAISMLAILPPSAGMMTTRVVPARSSADPKVGRAVARSLDGGRVDAPRGEHASDSVADLVVGSARARREADAHASGLRQPFRRQFLVATDRLVPDGAELGINGVRVLNVVRRHVLREHRPDHPARDLSDALIVDIEGQLLRTHTSPGQIA